MINISGEAGTGKTKQLAELAAKEQAVIVCENPDRMYIKLHGYDLVGLTCITYYDYIDRIMDRAENDVSTNAKYVIDDVAKFISYLSPNTVGFTSLTD